MELTCQMKEIIYYIFNCVMAESSKSFSINFYEDNVEISVYPMIDAGGASGVVNPTSAENVGNDTKKEV